MSELLAVLSNPRRRGRRKKKAGGSFQRVQQLTARRSRRRRGGVMQSVTRQGHLVSRARWHRSGYRRNPVGARTRAISKGIGQDLIAAVAGAAGGVALDFLMRPMPLMVKAGPLNHLVRGAAAIGLGLVAHVARVPMAGDLARGAMAITLYNAARQYVLLPRGLGELSDEDLTTLSNVTMDDEGMSEVIALPSAAAGYGMGEVLEGLEAGELYDE